MNSLFFTNPLSESVLRQRIQQRSQDARGDFFRDTTAIIHSRPFRRLKHKTQVFFAPRNEDICTRIEHSLHVATIAATICRALSLDSDLAWAISLGHDLGHPPFGHLGERTLSYLMGKNNFYHEIYSLRVVDKLAQNGQGLNLTYACRDGIIFHCGEKFEQQIIPNFRQRNLTEIKQLTEYPASWEGAIVRMADKIAYLGRDMEDALLLGLIKPEQIPAEVRAVLGENNSEIINTLVNDIIGNGLNEHQIMFSDSTFRAIKTCRDFNYNKIYNAPLLKNYHPYFERVLTTLYDYLQKLFNRHNLAIAAYRQEKNRAANHFGNYIDKMADFYEQSDGNYRLAIIDFMAAMSDEFAINCVKEIMAPHSFEVKFSGF